MRRVKDRGTLDNGMLVSPGEIIARAAATVPPERPPAEAGQDNGVRVWNAPQAENDTIVVAPATPNRRARRRPRDLIRYGWHYASRGALAAGLLGVAVGVPIWFFGSEAAETVKRTAADTYASIKRGTGVVALDKLTVEGRYRTTRDALRNALQIKKGDNLFASDPWSIKRRLEALPWVRSATVERRFPATLVVKIVERTAVARYRDKTGMVLVDESGAIIAAPPEKEHEALILLSGDGAPASAASLVKLLEQHPALARNVVAAARQGQRRWDLTFDGGAVVRLPEGYEQAAVAKFAEFERLHALLARGAVTYDMRLPDRLTIRASRTAAPAPPPPPPEKPAAKKPKKAG
jgi:cell division protein FtsQ